MIINTIFSGMLIFAFSLVLSGCNHADDEDEFDSYTNLVGKKLSAVEKGELDHPLTQNRQSQAVQKNSARGKTKDKKTEPAVAFANEKSNPANQKTGSSSTANRTKIKNVSRTSASVASGSRDVKILIPKKNFAVSGPQEAIRVSYDDINLLKVMNMEPVTIKAPNLMPDWLKNLNGKRIRIRGFMSPPFKAKNLDSFLLGRDNQACCYPGRAKIYDLFKVKMREGKTVDFIDNRPFDVVGIFHIDPWEEDGELWELYRISDAIVITR